MSIDRDRSDLAPRWLTPPATASVAGEQARRTSAKVAAAEQARFERALAGAGAKDSARAQATQSTAQHRAASLTSGMPLAAGAQSGRQSERADPVAGHQHARPGRDEGTRGQAPQVRDRTDRQANRSQADTAEQRSKPDRAREQERTDASRETGGVEPTAVSTEATDEWSSPTFAAATYSAEHRNDLSDTPGDGGAMASQIVSATAVNGSPAEASAETPSAGRTLLNAASVQQVADALNELHTRALLGSHRQTYRLDLEDAAVSTLVMTHDEDGWTIEIQAGASADVSADTDALRDALQARGHRVSALRMLHEEDS